MLTKMSLNTKLKIEEIYVRLRYLFVSDKRYALRQFKSKMGYELDLENPKTFSEKLQYLKLFYRNPLMELCADKYYCREYITACGYESILKDVYAVYNSVDEVKLEDLPQKSFARWNHMSGGNFVFDKSDNSKCHDILERLSIYQKFDWYYHGREWQYHNIHHKIIFEEYLENGDDSSLADYKFYCFGGEVKYYMVSFGEYEHKHLNHKFDVNNQSIDRKFREKEIISANEVRLPDNINEMLKIAKVLSRPFPHVRVDLYNSNGRIIFGELTFFSNSGFVSIESRKFNEEIGSWIDIKKCKNDLVK